MPPQRTQQPSPEELIKKGPTKGTCPECGNTYHKDLRRHRLVHLRQGLKVRRWNCKFYYVDETNTQSRCSSIFDDRSSLTRHYKSKHGYIPSCKDQTYEVVQRSSKQQVKDKRTFATKIATITKRKERVQPRRNDASGAEGLRQQPSQDSLLAGSVAPDAVFTSSPASAPAPPAARRASRPYPSKNSSSSSSSQNSDSSSQRPLRPTPSHQPIASGSSSRTTSTTSSRPRVSTNMPGPAMVSPASSYHSAINGVNDLFGPYGEPVSYPGSYPAYPQPEVHGPAPSVPAGRMSTQSLDIQPLFARDHSSTRPHQGWNLDNHGFAPYSYPDMGMGMNMPDSFGVPNTLAFDMPPQMSPMGLPYSPDTQRWNSRESSPASSPPPASRSRGGEAQNAYAYRYHSSSGRR
ncbi:uncharacterized protein TRAVEDRAFT_20056 [Trametes versicolor FP-101664 SS1]|uniref:uncharacterized protein n=1 Tax=Trametes versicolor (strain FP-101664) TaxID=717944 RepID=UPI00046219BB|nr:uncharacterized protein TRAVEDRAFT_20056 [Trametes versicolor FP-101664 SS1]EIW59747.1 hypothetical protein TRAVEDRAFT_20056 [Trametes versicolor FP-101664 SS1]